MGWSNRLHPRRALAGSGCWPRFNRWVQHPEYRQCIASCLARCRISLLVPVYFHTERGRAGLSANRRPFCRKLWELWSPNYRLDDAEYERTAKSFDNPDFVEVVIHSYRHRHKAVPGDPAFEPIEAELARQPVNTVPTIVLHGEADGVSPPQSSEGHDRHFTGPYQRRVVPVAGHFLPREAAEAVVQAVRQSGSEAGTRS